MPRDYAKKSSNSKNPLPGWIWMTGGLVIGLFVALLVYINEHQQKDSAPTISGVVEGFQKDIKDARKVAKQGTLKSAAKKKTSQSFDFYTILPELEVIIPDLKLSSDTKTQSKEGKDEYILQAGSFRKYEVAHRLKGNLAMLGVAADIQTVTINDKDTWHRIRIGPFRSLRKLDQTRRRLQKNGVHSIVLKIKS